MMLLIPLINSNDSIALIIMTWASYEMALILEIITLICTDGTKLRRFLSSLSLLNWKIDFLVRLLQCRGKSCNECLDPAPVPAHSEVGSTSEIKSHQRQHHALNMASPGESSEKGSVQNM